MDAETSRLSSSSQLSAGAASSSRVNVFCRLAPLPLASSSSACTLESESVLAVKKQQQQQQEQGLSNNSGSAQATPVLRYGFDRVLDASCSQADLFSAACASFSSEWRAGISATVLAYGQSGTGKSHSLLGPRLSKLLDGSVAFAMGSDDFSSSSSSSSLMARRRAELLTLDSSDGVLPRLLHDIFSSPSLLSAPDTHIELAALQIYCEEISDLLAPQLQQADAPTGAAAGAGAMPQSFFMPLPLAVREHPLFGVHVPGLTWLRVGALPEALDLVLRASAGRVVASTRLNSTSSRSHLVVMLRRRKGTQTSTAEEWDPRAASVLTVVDLAGSERIKKAFAAPPPADAAPAVVTNAMGGVVAVPQPASITAVPTANTAESRAINLSLTALGNVIAALAKRSKLQQSSQQSSSSTVHIPYRNSVLTRLLQRSLNGDSRMSLVVTVSQLLSNAAETHSTCEFGARAAAIRIKPVVASQKEGEDGRPCQTCASARQDAESLRAEVEQLRRQLEAQKQQCDAQQQQLALFASTPLSFAAASSSMASASAAGEAKGFPESARNVASQPAGESKSDPSASASMSSTSTRTASSGSADSEAALASAARRQQQLVAFYQQQNALLKQQLGDAEDKCREAEEAADAAKDELLEVLTLYRDARGLLKQGHEEHVSLMAEATEELEGGRIREEEQKAAIAVLEERVARLQQQNLLLARGGKGRDSSASTEDLAQQIAAAYEDTIEALVTRVEGLEAKLRAPSCVTNEVAAQLAGLAVHNLNHGNTYAVVQGQGSAGGSLPAAGAAKYAPLPSSAVPQPRIATTLLPIHSSPSLVASGASNTGSGRSPSAGTPAAAGAHAAVGRQTPAPQPQLGAQQRLRMKPIV